MSESQVSLKVVHRIYCIDIEYGHLYYFFHLSKYFEFNLVIYWITFALWSLNVTSEIGLSLFSTMYFSTCI